MNGETFHLLCAFLQMCEHVHMWRVMLLVVLEADSTTRFCLCMCSGLSKPLGSSGETRLVTFNCLVRYLTRYKVTVKRELRVKVQFSCLKPGIKEENRDLQEHFTPKPTLYSHSIVCPNL